MPFGAYEVKADYFVSSFDAETLGSIVFDGESAPAFFKSTPADIIAADNDTSTLIWNNNLFGKENVSFRSENFIGEDNFTVESALFYKRCYPDAFIIVSTWNDADEDALRILKNKGVEVVVSQLPSAPGHLNINYQVVSTLAGIRKAKEMGADYVCKTRTDQRLYHPNALNYLWNLVKLFPVNNEDFQHDQSERFVSVCMPYGDMFYPYCISDFLYFGFIDDIEKMFLIPQDNREKGKGGKGMTRRNIAQNLIAPEIQIIRSYIDSMGGNSECTVEAYWKFMKNHVISINRDEIGLFWPKYENRYSENRHFGYFYQKERKDAWNCYNFDFIHWLSLYNSTIKYDSKYEQYADYVL